MSDVPTRDTVHPRYTRPDTHVVLLPELCSLLQDASPCLHLLSLDAWHGHLVLCGTLTSGCCAGCGRPICEEHRGAHVFYALELQGFHPAEDPEEQVEQEATSQVTSHPLCCLCRRFRTRDLSALRALRARLSLQV